MKARALVIMAILGIMLVSVVCITSGADGASTTEVNVQLNLMKDIILPILKSPILWIGALILLFGFVTGNPLIKGIGTVILVIVGWFLLFGVSEYIITTTYAGEVGRRIADNFWISGPLIIGIIGLLSSIIGTRIGDVVARNNGIAMVIAAVIIIAIQITTGQSALSYLGVEI